MRIVLADTGMWSEDQVTYYTDKLSWLGRGWGDNSTVMVRRGDLRRLLEHPKGQLDPECIEAVARLKQAMARADV